MSKFLPIESQLKKLGFSFIAGIDEAGRGPLAGPVVSAAVILKPNSRIHGLNDSKKLTSQKRERLFFKIINSCLDYSISLVSEEIIDKFNILNATRIANELCIQELKTKPDFILCDGRDKQIFDQPFQNIIKGDSRVRSIAAASILAKVTRDLLMKKFAQDFPKYGFEKHMGYGTRKHRDAIKKYGYCKIHRKSFKLKENNDNQLKLKF